MDNDILTDDDFVGANLFGEVIASIPLLARANAQRMSETWYLADIIRECQTAPVTKSVQLYNEGKPVMGYDGMQSEVTLAFKLLNGGRREYKVKLRKSEYPNQHQAVQGRLKIIAREWDAGAEATGSGDRISSLLREEPALLNEVSSNTDPALLGLFYVFYTFPLMI